MRVMPLCQTGECGLCLMCNWAHWLAVQARWVLELLFHTLLTLAPFKRSVSFGTLLHLQRLGSEKQARPAGSQLLREGTVAGLMPPPFATTSQREGAQENTPFLFWVFGGFFLQSCKGESVRTATAGLQKHCICLDDEKPGKRIREQEAFLPEPSSMREGGGGE